MIRFIESDMAFDLQEDRACHLEKSPRYQAINSHAVSSVECVTLYERRGEEHILFIEAKKGAPNPSGTESEMALDEYMANLRAKYEHSIQMCYAALHGIDRELLEMGNKLIEALNHPGKMIFLLVVKRLEDKWCQELQAALQKELQHLRYIWKADVLVINEASAKRYHLIV